MQNVLLTIFAPPLPSHRLAEIVKSSAVPDIGTPEWETFINGGDENIKKMIEAMETAGQGAAAAH